MTFDRGYIILPEKMFTIPHLTATAQLTANRKSYQLFNPEIEFNVMEEMYAKLHCTCRENPFEGKPHPLKKCHRFCT